MGLLQKACETYDCFAHLAGVAVDGSETLAPISHILTAAQIEITLDRDGTFVAARAVDKSEPKIVIPVTEDSAGRTSAPCPHPLCDQLCYLAKYDEEKHSLYVQQLADWINSPYSHPKLKPILHYVEGGKIISDLSAAGAITCNAGGEPKNAKALVRWVVNGLGLDSSGPCWTDQALFQSFIRYYASKQQMDDQALCMVSGTMDVPARQHPKGIIPINGNAKLISANDTTNFTYRGRFTEDWQAATVGYAASQKAHNALRWIVANQGVRVSLPGDTPAVVEEDEKTYSAYGGRTFLCWNPQGGEIPSVTGALGRRNRRNQMRSAEPTAYREQLWKTLQGWKSELPEQAGVVIAAFDAATTGRLALTYYNELQASDFLERIYHWDRTCCWENGRYGVQPPLLYQIVNCAFGQPRDGKLVTDDRILRQQMQRLIACRIDQMPFPFDMERRIVQRASNLYIYDISYREQLLFCACAVIQKYHYDHDQEKERWNMETDLGIKDRSFQFGRLLAVLERTEQQYYWKTSSGKENGQDKNGRKTNAIRMMAVYCQRPWSTYEVINKKLRLAYLPRLHPGQRGQYAKLTDEIVGILSEMDWEQRNDPLEDTYLLGYHLQRKSMQNRTGNDKLNLEEEQEDE